MKKVVSIIVALVLLLSTQVNAFAVSSSGKKRIQYQLSDVGMTITIPSEYYALTRDVTKDDPALSLFGFTKDEWLDFAENSSIYLDAYDLDTAREIVVTMTDNIFSDLNLLPNSSIDLLITSLIDSFNKVGIDASNYDYYQHEQAKFIKLYLTQVGEKNASAMEYSTIYNNKSINITLHTYNTAITSDDESFLKEIIDSIVFSTEPLSVGKPEETSALTYTDDKTQTSFSLPDNWTEKPLYKERDTLDAKFISSDNEATIMYGSSDFYEMLGGSSIGIKRTDLDISIFSESDIEEYFGAAFDTQEGFERVVYHGITFYKTIATTTMSGFTINMTMVITIDDGFFYLFEYQGGRSNAHYDDFEYMLNSLTLG